MGKLLLYALVSFNNYVDQILPNFDPLPSSSRTFYILSTLCHVTPLELSTDPFPPLVAHVVIECPLAPVQLVNIYKGCYRSCDLL